MTPSWPSHVYLPAFAPAPSCPRKRVLAIMLPPLTSVFGSHIPNVSPFASAETGYRLYYPFERRDLAIGKACISARVGRVRILVVRATPDSPRVSAGLSLLDVEDFAARHVVVDDAVGESIQLVALPHEFGANRISLGVSHPMINGYLLNAIQCAGQHERRKTDDRDVCGDAVIILRIPLRNGQSLAPALRRTDEVVEGGPGAIHPLNESHRGIVSLLQLHVAEIPDRFVVQSPVIRICGICAGRWCASSSTSATASRLMTGIAAVGDESLSEWICGEAWNGSVHPATAQLRGSPAPR